MFDEENLISLAIFLSFCPLTYVHPNPASHEPANYKKESLKWTIFVVFRIISVFYSKYSHFLFREKFCIFRKRTKCKKKYEIFGKFVF